mmetsp:Transcript_17280/g.54272  ORF Transcript_17280/g.54272 Transcript_17280/m.54272 type:complete len:196 (-) Transcript_17280:267-854(-)
MWVHSCIVQWVPVFGPLLGTRIEPSFEDIDKLMMALALVQGLLLSCLAGGFQDSYPGHCVHDNEELFNNFMGWGYWSFQILCLCIFFTVLAYSYIVFLIEQESKDASSNISLFWRSGGRLVVVGLALFTVVGAGCFEQSVAIALECMYDRRFGMDIFEIGLMPITAAVGTLLIHGSFLPLVRAQLKEEEEAKGLL